MAKRKQRHALYFARKARGFTLEELAERAGSVSVGCISRNENLKTRHPHPFIQQALAEALGFQASDIWPDPRLGQKLHPAIEAAQARARANGGRTKARRSTGR